MRHRAVFASLFFVMAFGTSSLLAACSGTDPDDGDVDPDGPGGGGDGGGGGGDGAQGDGATGEDGAAPTDGAIPTDGGDDADTNPGVPAVQRIGRFDDTDGVGPRMAWPGTRVVARFNGTGASVTLSRTHAGFQGGPSWFNVVVDGTVTTTFSVSGASEVHTLASELPLGDHTVEIEKRTEANHGTVRFEGFAFEGGTGLLPPPARRTRRIEFVSESTIDGFGVEGTRVDTTAANYCNGGAPPQFDNVRKSVAFYTAEVLAAEMHVTAYSGKGIAQNNSAGDTATMPVIFGRALPDPGAGTTWSFASWTPDVVVVSLGGVDYKDGVAGVPSDFQTKYTAFLATIRAHYPNAEIWVTVWSQIKGASRTSLSSTLDAVVAARASAGDNAVRKLLFPEAVLATDETGCYFHANDAHHAAMATTLSTAIKTVTGW